MRNKLLFWHKFKKMATYAATINKGSNGPIYHNPFCWSGIIDVFLYIL